MYRRADGRWCAALSLGRKPDGKRDRAYFYGATQAEALAARDEARARRKAGAKAKPARQSVGAFLDWWLKNVAARNNRPLTVYGHGITINARIKPSIGKVPLADLAPRHIHELLREWQDDGLAVSTQRKIHGILRSALSVALGNGDILRNPCQIARPPKLGKKQKHAMSEAQARTFLAGLEGERLRALHLTAIACGPRVGELIGLRKPRLDLPGGFLHITEQLVCFRGHTEWGPPKTDDSARTVKLAPIVVEALALHLTQQAEDRLAAGPAWENLELVFCKPDGSPLDRRRVLEDLTRILAGCGLEHFTFHELRHSAATLLIAAGEPLNVVQEMLGHASPAFTAAVYVHPTKEMHEDAAARMDSILRPKPQAKKMPTKPRKA